MWYDGNMIKMLPFFLFACQEPTQYDKDFAKWSAQTSWLIDAKIDVGKHDVDVTFHGTDKSKKEDLTHVQLASQRFMSGYTPTKLEECVNRIDKVDIFHVPCSTLNDDYQQGSLRDYPIDDVQVLIGVTSSEQNGSNWDRSDWDFAVGYCYDEMVDISTRVNYETDGFWRELSLAHEMTHVWQRACNPLDDIFSPGKSEKIAWSFHESYKETAQKLHVEY